MSDHGWAKRLTGGYLVLIGSVAIAVGVLQIQNTQLTNRLHSASTAACQRLNIQRAETNSANFASWQFFRLVIHLTATSASRRRPAALAFARQLDAYTDEVKWTPLTNCVLAVDDAARYVSPAPRAFYLTPGGGTPAAISAALK